MRDHPTVDTRSNAVALRCSNKELGRYDRVVLIAHAQQELVVRPSVQPRLQRLNRLAEQLETVLLERVVDARRPLHLLAATHEVDIGFLVRIHTVASRLFRGRARAIRRADQRRHVIRLGEDRHDTDTDPETECPIIPDETKFVDDLA